MIVPAIVEKNPRLPTISVELAASELLAERRTPESVNSALFVFSFMFVYLQSSKIYTNIYKVYMLYKDLHKFTQVNKILRRFINDFEQFHTYENRFCKNP
jgi:hypothetical protein